MAPGHAVPIHQGTVDYLRAVAPRHAVPIHQGIIAPEARGIFYGRLTEMTDTDFRVLREEHAQRF